jgi:hypothetical protein
VEFFAHPQMGQAAAVSGYVVPQTSQITLFINEPPFQRIIVTLFACIIAQHIYLCKYPDVCLLT